METIIILFMVCILTMNKVKCINMFTSLNNVISISFSDLVTTVRYIRMICLLETTVRYIRMICLLETTLRYIRMICLLETTVRYKRIKYH